jgi:hypothetical protein
VSGKQPDWWDGLVVLVTYSLVAAFWGWIIMLGAGAFSGHLSYWQGYFIALVIVIVLAVVGAMDGDKRA